MGIGNLFPFFVGVQCLEHFLRVQLPIVKIIRVGMRGYSGAATSFM